MDDKLSIVSDCSGILETCDLGGLFSDNEEINNSILFEVPQSSVFPDSQVAKPINNPGNMVAKDQRNVILKNSNQLNCTIKNKISNNSSQHDPLTKVSISPIIFNKENLTNLNPDKEDDENTNIPQHEEVLSLYAPTDEDCVSLYSNFNKNEFNLKHKSRLPSMAMTGLCFTNPGQISKVQQIKQVKETKPKIFPIPPKDLKINLLVTKVVALLNKNNRESVRKAAATFQNAYVSNNISGVNSSLVNTIQRLSSLLLFYKEMKFLYRIMRFSIELKVTPIDRVLTGLFDKLGQNHENKKINVILKLIKGRGLPVGQVVYQCADKYLNCDENNNFLITNMVDVFPKSQQIGMEDMQVDNTVQKLSRCTKSSRSKNNKNFRRGYHRANKYNKNRNSTFFKINHKQGMDHLSPIWKNIRARNGIAQSAFQTFQGIRHVSLDHDIIPKTTIYNNRTIPMANPSAIYDACILAANDADWSTVGKLFAKMVYYLKPSFPIDDHFSNISRKIAFVPQIGDYFDVSMQFDLFLSSAIENFQQSDNESDHLEKCLTRIGVDVAMRVSPDVCYEIITFMQQHGLSFVPISNDKHSQDHEMFLKSRAALVLAQACMNAGDPRTAYNIICQFFIENQSAPLIAHQAVAPALNDSLRNLAFWLLNNGSIEEVTNCVSLLPAAYGAPMDVGLLCQLLRLILQQSVENDVDFDTVVRCMHITIDQMLPRQMIRALRRVIVTTEFKVSLLIAFKYLEQKGIYQSPRILEYPHLIIIPSSLFKEEMALMIYRHLKELAQFLSETNQNLRLDLPFRVVLCYPQPKFRHRSCITSACLKYQSSCQNLEQVFQTTMKPPLKVLNVMKVNIEENMYNISMPTVKKWLYTNASYIDVPMPQHQVFGQRPSLTNKMCRRDVTPFMLPQNLRHQNQVSLF